MYENDIFDQANGNQPAEGLTTGNFSGARPMSFETHEINRVESTAYFNHLDSEPDAVQPVTQDVVQPVTQEVPQPASQETPQPAVQAVSQAASQPTVQPTPQAASQPTVQAAPQPAVQPAVQSAPQPTVRPASQTASQSTFQSAPRTSTWTEAPVQRADVRDKKPEHVEKKMGFGQKLMLSISLGLFFGIFAGVGFFGVMQVSNAVQSKEPEIVEEITQIVEDEIKEIEEVVPQIQQAGSNVVYTSSDTDVTAIVKDVMPAMVSIINNYTEVTSFWGQTYREELSASGSGIIVAENEKELLIVTNQHVIADTEQLLVTLSDDTEVEAKVKGMDAEMDLAIIAINLEDLSSETMEAIAIANLGDSDELDLGQRVIAIGNALGYGQSVTVGYISALDREIELEDGSVRSFIQTDAAINPGNSGGALLNAAGEVIGINSNKIGGTSIEGMGYAIPITAASPIIADLMERRTREKVDEDEKGYLGISPQDISAQIAQMYGMPKGVYVVNVYEDSAAEKAGIVKGDVITKFDGERITSNSDLQKVMQYYAVGDSVKVTVMRPENGEYVERELTLILGEKPDTVSRY